MPAKCGSSPRAKVGIERSVRLSAPGSPMSSAHFCSRRQPSSGSRPSASSDFQPCISRALKSGWWKRRHAGGGTWPAWRLERVKVTAMRCLLPRVAIEPRFAVARQGIVAKICAKSATRKSPRCAAWSFPPPGDRPQGDVPGVVNADHQQQSQGQGERHAAHVHPQHQGNA